MRLSGLDLIERLDHLNRNRSHWRSRRSNDLDRNRGVARLRDRTRSALWSLNHRSSAAEKLLDDDAAILKELDSTSITIDVAIDEALDA